MVRRCSDKMAKMLMVIFNFVFLVCGIAIIALSLTSKVPADWDAFVAGLKNVHYGFLAFGIIIAFISFMGCCGALKESNCMVTTFLVFLVAIFVAEIAIGGMAFAKRTELETEAKKAGVKMIVHGDKAARALIDDIQTSLNCCGMNGVNDYVSNGVQVPPSCCTGNATCSDLSPSLKKTGCFPQIEEKIKHNLVSIGVVAIIVCFVELVGIIFACCLRSAINERYESV